MRAAVSPALPRQPAASRSMFWQLSPVLAVALAVAGLLLLVSPLGEFPIEDDWLYARAVQALLKNGQLEVPAWTATSLILQAVWGALFALAFGFSHTTLRLSTLVLALVGAIGCFVLFQDLLDTRRALLGTLLLLLNPLYVFLSYSFMTDVPFLALALWAMVCYVRALRASPPDKARLAAASALAGAAYLVRQLGLALPLAALGALLMIVGWRTALHPRMLLPLVAPVLPAVIIGGYIDEQRGPIREEGLAWMLVFWAENGLGMLGVLLSRAAGAFTTLGLFTLPLSVGIAGPALRPALKRWQRWLIVGLLFALGVGFIVRVTTFGLRVLFPHVSNILTRRGFFVFGYSGSPESLVVPDWGLAVVTLGSILGAALLVVAIVVLLPMPLARGRTAMPLLFGLIVLGQTLLYRQFFDRYLLDILPSALLAVLLVVPRPRLGSTTIALAGAVVLAAWSIWWERDYLDRRLALWQAGQELVERGIPPDEIDGGYEWIGWYRGQSILAAAPALVEPDGIGRRLENYVSDSMNMKKARWAVAYELPQGVPESRVIATVPYGHGQRVVALQRF